MPPKAFFPVGRLSVPSNLPVKVPRASAVPKGPGPTGPRPVPGALRVGRQELRPSFAAELRGVMRRVAGFELRI